MKELRESIKNIIKVFSDVKYFLALLFITVLFYSFNVLILNISNIISFYDELGFFGSLKLFFIFFLNLWKSITLYSFFSLIIISLLFGILICLLLYRHNILNAEKKSLGFLSSLGIFLGILVPGCASCGIGLLSVLGLSAAFVNFLPFDGLEFSIIAILIMIMAVFITSKNLFVCKIKRV